MKQISVTSCHGRKLKMSGKAVCPPIILLGTMSLIMGHEVGPQYKCLGQTILVSERVSLPFDQQ